MALSGQVKPWFATEKRPARLVMELPGTAVAGTIVRRYVQGPVREIACYQDTPRSVRVAIALDHPIGSGWHCRRTEGGIELDLGARSPHGAYRFAGIIYNINTGEPVAGVNVNVHGFQIRTNASGRFQFQALPSGQLLVSVAAAGFAPQSFLIRVPEESSYNLFLVPSQH